MGLITHVCLWFKLQRSAVVGLLTAKAYRIYVPQAHVALVTIFFLFVIFWLSEDKAEKDSRPVKVVDLKDHDGKTPNGNGVLVPVEGIVVKPLGVSLLFYPPFFYLLA